MGRAIEFVEIEEPRHPVSGFSLLRPARLSFTVDISLFLGLSVALSPRNANTSSALARWEGARQRQNKASAPPILPISAAGD